MQKATIFAGDYERIIRDRTTEELYCMGGDAIYVRQSGGRPDRIYYACKDHLGSIVKLVDGYYEVYLVIDQRKDYHWYRQDKGGNWSHKPGRTPVINVDASGRFISNPVRANHNYGYVNYNNGARKLWVRRR